MRKKANKTILRLGHVDAASNHKEFATEIGSF
jgi:hypothetical protein